MQSAVLCYKKFEADKFPVPVPRSMVQMLSQDLRRIHYMLMMKKMQRTQHQQQLQQQQAAQARQQASGAAPTASEAQPTEAGKDATTATNQVCRDLPFTATTLQHGAMAIVIVEHSWLG